MYLTIDTNVLVRSDVRGDPARPACLVFLRELKEQATAVLVLDDEGLIEREYLRRLAHTKFGYHWLTYMLRKNRYRPYPRAELPRRPLRKLLDRCHMDPNDLNLFVRTAWSTPSKRIVTHDGDYWGRSRLCMTRELGLSVDSARTIHDTLCNLPFEECVRRVMGG